MTGISTMKEFKTAFENPELKQQRTVAARFIENVLDLIEDDRVR